MYDAWQALHFLHVMWTEDKLVIIDFSLWERWPVPAQRQLPHAYCTPGFRAPELALTRHMTQEQLRKVVLPALDWWSLGCAGACLAWVGTEPQLRPKWRKSRLASCAGMSMTAVLYDVS